MLYNGSIFQNFRAFAKKFRNFLKQLLELLTAVVPVTLEV